MHNFRFLLNFTFILASISTFSTPAKANGLLDFFFPKINKGPSPAETLKAPFADEDAVIEEMDASGNAANQTPLHLRHRTNDIITSWVQITIPEMITYKAKSYNKEYRDKIKYFDRIGLAEYIKFLKERNFITTLKTGRYDISGFIKNYPIILNEGAIDGRYRWLYQANIMLTYIQSGTRDYSNIKQEDAITQEFILTFQIGRSRQATNEHGLLIESWDVKPVKK